MAKTQAMTIDKAREAGVVVTYKVTHSLKPYKNNPRLNDDAVDMVAKSIEAYGFLQPIVIDENDEIVAGHTRWKAALKLGMLEVPCIDARHLTKAQIKAYRIADNATRDLSTWEPQSLQLEIHDLKLEHYPLELTGFTPERLELLMLESPSENTAPPQDDINHEDFWPTISLRVPPETKELYDSVMNRSKGTKEEEKFNYILGLANESLSGTWR